MEAALISREKAVAETAFEKLQAANEQHRQTFSENALMWLITHDDLTDERKREQFLAAIQTFSNNFQKAVLLRQTLHEDVSSSGFIREHTREEFDHDRKLSGDRGHAEPVWDPVLEATTSWFIWKMFTLDEIEKTLLMHWVLETSADMFFPLANEVMGKYSQTNYFAIHAHADADHAKMADEYIKLIPDSKVERYITLLDQAWDILGTACARIAHLTVR